MGTAADVLLRRLVEVVLPRVEDGQIAVTPSQHGVRGSELTEAHAYVVAAEGVSLPLRPSCQSSTLMKVVLRDYHACPSIASSCKAVGWCEVAWVGNEMGSETIVYCCRSEAHCRSFEGVSFAEFERFATVHCRLDEQLARDSWKKLFAQGRGMHVDVDSSLGRNWVDQIATVK